MILVDSSAWIEYYRPGGLPSVQARVAEAIERDEAATNGIIEVEIRAFAAGERDRRLLAADFAAYHRLALDHQDFELACSLGFDLRRNGLTVPATGLIIAASAIRAGVELIHLDQHFVHVGEVSELRQTHLQPSEGDPGGSP